MPRPKRRRMVAREPHSTYFKPAGVPVSTLEVVLLEMDELEAIRLADYKGLYQEDAAEQLGVSRQTFGRIVASARKKVAEALTKGKAIRIEGGVIEMSETRTFQCVACSHVWSEPLGTGPPEGCPKCGSSDFRRVDDPRGMGGGGSGPAAGRGSGGGQGRGSGSGGGQGGDRGGGQGGGQGGGRGGGQGGGRGGGQGGGQGGGKGRGQGRGGGRGSGGNR